MIRSTVSYLAKAGILRWSLVLCLIGSSSSVFSFQIYQDDFNANYGTQGTRLDSCGLCHYNFAGGGPRTLYGEDYRNNNYSAAAIGAIDSDGDGVSNDAESALGTLTFPGLSCNDLANVINAPADTRPMSSLPRNSSSDN